MNHGRLVTQEPFLGHANVEREQHGASERQIFHDKPQLPLVSYWFVIKERFALR